MPTINTNWYGYIPGAVSVSNNLLADQFTGSTVLLSLSKENSAYNGNCVQISSSSGTNQVNIGFTGTNINMTALNAALAGGTRFVDTWYDQSGNGNNATQSGSSRFQIIIDDDGKPTITAGDFHSTHGMVIADNASHKTTVIDAYWVGKLGNADFDSTNDPHVWLGWMATTTTTFGSQARWAIGAEDMEGLYLPRNATAFSQRKSTTLPSTSPINASRSLEFAVHYYNSNRLVYRNNDDLMWDDVTNNGTATANVTYSGTGALYIGMQGNGAANTNSKWRTIVLYGTTRADRSSITNYLINRWSINTTYPTSYSSSDGFTWTPSYSSTFVLDTSDDANGLRFWYENGGMRDNGTRGPSCAIANNVNNGVTLTRLAVDSSDSDAFVTGAERAERGFHLGASTAIAKGDTFERFFQFYVEPGNTMNGSWCMIGQVHYDLGASPDIMLLNMKGDQLEVITQRNGTDTSRSTPVSYSRNTWYAVRARGVWSAGGASDVLQVWFGANGTTLTQITNASGSLFSTDTVGAYPKQGIYRGDQVRQGEVNNPGVFAVRFANEMFSKTSGAYASFVTTQPNLPTHP